MSGVLRVTGSQQSAQGPVSDHQCGPFVGEVHLGGEAETSTQERRYGGGVAEVRLCDDTSAGRTVVEYEVGDGLEQVCAESSAAVGDTADKEVNTGVVRAGGVVAGQWVEVGAVDLPVAHRGAVQYAEAGGAAPVAVQLGAEMVLQDALRAFKFPEGGYGWVVHPATDQRQVAFDTDGNQLEDAGTCGDRPPRSDVVEQVVVRQGRRGAARCVCSRSVGCVPVPGKACAGPLVSAAVGLSASSTLSGDQVDEFVGQTQVQGVGDVRAGAGVGACELVGAGTRVGGLVGDGIGKGGGGRESGVGARVGG